MKRKVTLSTLLKKLDGMESSLKKVEQFVDSRNRISTEKLRLYYESNFHRRPLSKIFRHRRAFGLCIKMLADGYTYKEIAVALSNIRGFGYTSKSSVGRFRDLYMRGIREKR